MAPVWSKTGGASGAQFGYSLASAGDVNGDGFADAVIGAWRWRGPVEDEGKAEIFLGSAAGLSPEPAWQVVGPHTYAWFGRSVAGVGDVDGDGYDDVAIGASSYSETLASEGAVYLYRGGPGGPSTTEAWKYHSGQTTAFLGRWVSGAGDVNGDGYADFLATAHFWDNPERNEGLLLVFHGGPLGAPDVPSWSFEGNVDGAILGRSAASAGDVNGDGYDDVVVGAYGQNGNTGVVYGFYGSPSGLATAPSWVIQGTVAASYFGWSAVGVGDVNRDGFDDVVVTGYLWTVDQLEEGKALLYLGSIAGLSSEPAWQAEGNQISAEYGFEVSPAGDLDRDGYDDVLVSAVFFDDGEDNEGRVYLYRGGPTGLEPEATWHVDGNQMGAHLGRSLALIGDVRGNGTTTIMMGANDYDQGFEDEGAAFAYENTAVDPGPAPDAGTEMTSPAGGCGCRSGDPGVALAGLTLMALWATRRRRAVRR